MHDRKDPFSPQDRAQCESPDGHSRRAILRRIHILLRMVSYALGAAGALLIHFARTADAATRQRLFSLGAGLMLLMFLLFTASYGIYFYLKYSSSSRS